MKDYTNVLREMLEDVTANVEAAKNRVDDCTAATYGINSELQSSNAELSNIKASFSGVWKKALKAKMKKGITSEEAREAANRLSEYAGVVDQISDKEEELMKAQDALKKAEETVVKRTNVLAKLGDLMDAVGMCD